MSSSVRIALWLLLSELLWLPSPRALALNPALDVSQYAHATWRIRDGFVKGEIHAIAQTPDGFLLLGTDFGLVRFDGVRTTPWQPGRGRALPSSVIRNLLVARDGALWIATQGGLARWSRGELSTYRQLNGWVVNGLAQDRQGTVWAAAYATGLSRLCAIGNSRIDCYGKDGNFGAWVDPVVEDRNGILWIATAKGLWHWRPGPPRLISLPDTLAGGPYSLTGMSTGGILALTANGAYQIVEGKVTEYWIPSASSGWHPNAVVRDRDGAIWIGGQGNGILHLHNGRRDEFGPSDGLSGDRVGTLFEDREGNVWASTVGGLDRFRALPATTYSTRQGVVGFYDAVLADRDGSIWFSTSVGLYRWQGDHFTVYRAIHEKSYRRPQQSMRSDLVREVTVRGLGDSLGASLFQDHRGRVWLSTTSGLGYLEHNRFESIAGMPPGLIDSIVEEPDGDLWVAHEDAGLLELSSDRVVREIPWTKIGRRDFGTRVAVDPGGGLWVGFLKGGIVHVVDGQFRSSYGSREGLAKGRVNALRIASDGAVWVATDGGLSRLKAGHIATLSTKDGLPCDDVDSSIEDEGSLWVYTACGLVSIADPDLQSWIAGLDQPQPRRSKIPLKVLEDSDGVRSFSSLSSLSPHIARTADGRLWFVAPDGLTVVDPRHLTLNPLPPPVHVEQLIADRAAFDPSLPVHLPPLVRDLQIDYTALSLVAPEKVQFRYRLEGRDEDWQDVGTRRQAFYSDLPPGSYRFRVIASNNSGVWNTQGATLAFTIAPAYWQTNWFRALCVLVLLGLLWTAYLLRLRQLTSAFNMRLEARVGERTRIARELHDTLLQGFQGLLLRFQTVAAMLPNRPDEAKQVAVSAVDQAAQAITEGRRAVQGLRASIDETNDFATELRTAGELAAAETGNESVVLRVEVEGSPRTLHPIVRDDVYRIACEALRNAFRHAQARHIEVELEYHERELRLRIRDDGKGMDAKGLKGGDEGAHFGLHGMRERAKLIDGQLDVWSAPAKGTEVDLSVPASRAYATK